MIDFEERGPIGILTIDRPERRNALSVELCDELAHHLTAERSLRALVITGAGSSFCAGADLGRRGASGGWQSGAHAQGEDHFHPPFERMLKAVVAYPAPVVAAINGPALGAGTQLAVACDLRVAAPGAIFGIPATSLGVMLLPENIARLAMLVGQGHARDLLLTGRRIDVDEALRMGLVNRTAGDARAAALGWAEEIAAGAPLTVAGHKAVLNALARHMAFARGRDDALLGELDSLVSRAFSSEDLSEGLAAFTEKRRPHFRGQ